ncbi:MAG TPA: ABC transporter permease [Gemmatimonadaceae bacterium]|jgi:predicted permease
MAKRRGFIQWPWRSRATIAREVDDELAFHLGMRIAELVSVGLNADLARAQATREFGDIEFTRAYCNRMDTESERSMRIGDSIDEWRRDFHHAFRVLRSRPAFSAICVLTLAIAIGANTAVFSVARAVLLAPLPYGNPDALVRVYDGSTTDAKETNPFSPANFADYAAQVHTLRLAATSNVTATFVPPNGDSEILSSLNVTPNAFDVLGVRPVLGRTFRADEDRNGHDDKVLLSYRLWQRVFGGDSSIIGRRVTINGQSTEVVGVMPVSFTLGFNEELWTPFSVSDLLTDVVRARRQHYLHVIGRLAPNATMESARSELTTVAQRLERQYPEANKGRAIVIMSMREAMAGRLRTPVLLLQGAALMVLLIACANLANLTLSRGVTRRREMAVRAALGAGRARLVRQLLAESVVVAVIGGACGAALAIVATRMLLALNAGALPSMFEVSADGRVLGFSLLLAAGSGVVLGLLPALDAARVDLNDSLKSGGRGMSGTRGGERTRRTLVVAQIGLAVMLLIGAGLLVRSFDAITGTRLGYDPAHVLTAQIRASGPRYDSTEALNRFYDGVLNAIKASPGVVAAGAVNYLPTRGRVGTSLRIIGKPIDETNLPDIGYTSVRDDYLATMRIPIIAGRDYDRSDLPDGAKTVLINQAAAKHFFPNGDAIGQRIVIGPNAKGTPMTIIGIVGDVRTDGLDIPPKATLVANHRQESWERSISLTIRTSGDPRAFVPTLRRIVKASDPAVGLRDAVPLEDIIGSSLAPRRLALALASSFAVIALLLAVIGIYGVLSYAVETRNREIGVRVALGASARSVLLLVLRQGATWSVVGLALGVAGAIGTGRLLSGMLYGVEAIDPTTYAVVGVGLLAVVTVACLVPALRAMRVDPMTSMRAD